MSERNDKQLRVAGIKSLLVACIMLFIQIMVFIVSAGHITDVRPWIFFATAFTVIVQALTDISNFLNGTPRIIHFQLEIFFFLVIFLLVSIILVIYLKVIGKKTNSPLIQSEANEKLFDVFISLSVLIGFISILFKWYILDSIIGLIIAGFII